METDSEAGTFVAYYEPSLENGDRAERFTTLINALLADEAKLYAILEAEGDLVGWD